MWTHRWGQVNLRALLTDVSSVKEALQENICEISIPRTGAALLEPRPEGLLNRVFLLVTPRGVHKKVPKVKARPESICKLDLAKIDLRKRGEATKRKV